jgi:hypothetical protein
VLHAVATPGEGVHFGEGAHFPIWDLYHPQDQVDQANHHHHQHHHHHHQQQGRWRCGVGIESTSANENGT